jgi:antibiotic biosynthesis monooxygenase (ABM) superfamily enzyme
MLFPDHFLAVRATVAPGRDDEFNHWYNSEHTPDAVKAFPGCIGGARYRVVLGDGSHQYIALYAFESAEKMEAALTGPEIKKLLAIYDADVGSFSTRNRNTYSKIFEFMRPA